MGRDTPAQPFDMQAMQLDLEWWLTPEQIKISIEAIAASPRLGEESYLIEHVVGPYRDIIYDNLGRAPEKEDEKEERAQRIIAFCILQGLRIKGSVGWGLKEL